MGLHTHLQQVGQNIRRARLRRGFRQIDVNERIGVNYRHYQNIEAGRVNLTIEMLCRLARLFQVRLEELVRDVCV